MAIVEIKDIKGAIKPYSRLMGLDLGTKTIGLALSDVMLNIASSFETIKRTKFTADAVLLIKAIEEQEVGGLVLGLPVEMDGTEGSRCQATRAFANNVLGKIDIPITFWDERLSTNAVERVLIKGADMTRKRRKEVVDKLAAAYILQGALDAIGYQSQRD